MSQRARSERDTERVGYHSGQNRSSSAKNEADYVIDAPNVVERRGCLLLKIV